MTRRSRNAESIALLLSGGLDSTILLGHLLKLGYRVHPVYVAMGTAWQSAERRAVGELLDALENDALESVVELEMPLADLYGGHWSMTGCNVPDESTPDEAVYLWGRNPLLLVKVMLWCEQHGVSRVALATLNCNPFSDATPRFFDQFEQALATATGAGVEILRPFAEMNKEEVLELGTGLPLHLTFSCLAPQEGRHCGVCNKCAERTRGLRSLSSGDPTVYATELSFAD